MGIKLYRPKSISGLVLFGFAVVSIPLVAATVFAVLEVGRLAQLNRTAVLESQIAAAQSRALVEQLTEMQRALGQYEVRGDRDFYRFFLERRTVLRNAIENLNDLDLTESIDGGKLAELNNREQELFERLGGESGQLQGDTTWSGASETLAALGDLARLIQAESNQITQGLADDAVEGADRLQHTLLILAAATIPTAMLLAALFVIAINRPLKDLGLAIRRLGARKFDGAIKVHGPRDVEALGTQLDWLRRRLQDLEGQKTRFLQHISHELKTPLTTIREGAELLEEGFADEKSEDAEIVQLMRSNSLYLQELIEDLLQFARTQDPVSDLDLSEDIDLAGLVANAISRHNVTLAAKKLSVEQHLAKPKIQGDEKKLRIVVDNLLINAIKYTPPGGNIGVSLRVCAGSAVIDFQDSGPGIHGAETDEIFEPFRQGRAQSLSNVKGTGLGLSIAKEYVEAHDGRIKVVPSTIGAHLQVVLPIDGPAALQIP